MWIQFWHGYFLRNSLSNGSQVQALQDLSQGNDFSVLNKKEDRGRIKDLDKERNNQCPEGRKPVSQKSYRQFNVSNQ